MIRFRKEGEEVKNGINLYPFNDRHSIGGYIKFGHYVGFLRYSKKLKKWFSEFYKFKYVDIPWDSSAKWIEKIRVWK